MHRTSLDDGNFETVCGAPSISTLCVPPHTLTLQSHPVICSIIREAIASQDETEKKERRRENKEHIEMTLCDTTTQIEYSCFKYAVHTLQWRTDCALLFSVGVRDEWHLPCIHGLIYAYTHTHTLIMIISFLEHFQWSRFSRPNFLLTPYFVVPANGVFAIIIIRVFDCIPVCWSFLSVHEYAICQSVYVVTRRVFVLYIWFNFTYIIMAVSHFGTLGKEKRKKTTLLVDWYLCSFFQNNKEIHSVLLLPLHYA